MGKKIIIFVILGFFISLIIKIEYFSVVLNLMAIATIMSLKHGRKKIKFDIELWLFQMTIIFYLFRESGLGLFTELENFYNNFNKVKIIFSIFFIIGMVYSAKIKGNILLKLYFFISLIIMIVCQNIFYIKKIYNKNWIDSIVFLDMIYSPYLLDCWIVGIIIFNFRKKNTKYIQSYLLLIILILLKIRIIYF